MSGQPAASRSRQPSAATLRWRFLYTIACLVVAVVLMGLVTHDPLAIPFGLGLGAPGMGVAVLYLDRHRFFARYRLRERQRRWIIGLLVATVIAYTVALVFAVTSSNWRPLVVAVVLGYATAILSGAFLLQALSRGEREGGGP